jgi:hypothetical protein
VKISFFAAAAAVLLLGACAPSGGVDGAAPPASPVQVSDDQYSPQVTLVGTTQRSNSLSFNPLADTMSLTAQWLLRTFINKTTHVVTTQLYVVMEYQSGGWKFYNAASDDHAHPLEFVGISQNVSSCDSTIGKCNYTEIFAFSLDQKTLEHAATAGYSVKVSAKDGESIILPLSPVQIQAQIEAIKGSQYASKAKT